MQNTQASGATAQPKTLPYAYSIKTVKKALFKEPVRYHARPLFKGAAVTIIVTATDVEQITPAGHAVFGDTAEQINLDFFLGCRIYLESYVCDTIRFDARALPIDGRPHCITDIFRMTLLQEGVATHQKLFYPEFPDGRDGSLQRHYVEIKKDNAPLQLDFAKGVSWTLHRKIGPPYEGVTAALDGVLWASEATIEAPTFLIPL